LTTGCNQQFIESADDFQNNPNHESA
jgi:hypothetical protein